MKRKETIIFFCLLFLLFLGLYLSSNISFFDEFIYDFVINLKSEAFTNFMKIITFFASTKFIMLLMFIFLVIYFLKNKKIFLIMDIIVLGEVILNNSIKLIIGRERPELINLVTETSYSFPSGHTMVAVVLYGFIMYIVSKLKINKYLRFTIISLFSSLIILIMMSRIYLGVHYASDVFAGMSLSIAYLILMIDLLERRKYL